MNQKDVERAIELIGDAVPIYHAKGWSSTEWEESKKLAITALESMQELERYRKTPLCGNCESRRTGMV